MSDRVLKAVQCLGEIEAKDLDSCSVGELCQLMFWLNRHQGSIFVKTVGRLALSSPTAAGYAERMKPICLLCKREMQNDESFIGKKMWHSWTPVCRHERFYTCPDCIGMGAGRIKCSVCGCGEFYT